MIFDAPQNFIHVFSGTVGEVHGSKRGKAVINIISGGTFKFSDHNQGKQLYYGILIGLAWGFLCSWMLVLICCKIYSLLVPLGSRSISNETALTVSLP